MFSSLSLLILTFIRDSSLSQAFTAAALVPSKSQESISAARASFAPSILTGDMATLSRISSPSSVWNDARPYILSILSNLLNGFWNSAAKYMRWFFAQPFEYR